MAEAITVWVLAVVGAILGGIAMGIGYGFGMQFTAARAAMLLASCGLLTGTATMLRGLLGRDYGARETRNVLIGYAVLLAAYAGVLTSVLR